MHRYLGIYQIPIYFCVWPSAKCLRVSKFSMYIVHKLVALIFLTTPEVFGLSFFQLIFPRIWFPQSSVVIRLMKSGNVHMEKEFSGRFEIDIYCQAYQMNYLPSSNIYCPYVQLGIRGRRRLSHLPLVKLNTYTCKIFL